MNDNDKFLPWIFKGIIWVGLAVILFSPLYVSSALFFPFIVTKTIAFQISVEVIFLAFLLLCLADEKYRLHSNLTVVLMLSYLVILTIASAFFGNDFYHSFWSNNERGDGILLLFHLFLFAVVLTGFFRSVKEWMYLFDLFIVASFCVGLVALDQYLSFTFPAIWTAHLMPSSDGARLAATIGNAGYVGGYMVFGVFTALFLALKRSNFGAKSWYVLVILLELFIAIQTQTRGAYLALLLGVTISAIYLMWFYYQNKYLKITLAALIILSSLFIVGIFVFKNSPFVRNQPVLTRIAFTSLNDATSNNRLVTWGIGLKGFLDKPLLGWGQENFYQVFDKYYTTRNTEQWFDRCHNMICDRAITGGILGLLSYLALLLLPFWAIWRYYRKEYADQTGANKGENKSRRYLTPIIFTILIIAYIIQNMFIFEALVTYVPLVMVLSFVGLYSRGWDFDWFDKKPVKATAAVIGGIFMVVAIFYFNLATLYANIDFIKALTAQTANLSDKVNAFEEVISRGTLGNQEYRRHYANFYEQTITNYLSDQQNRSNEADQQLADFANKMEAQFNNQLAENSHNVSNYLLLLRFYNLSYYFDVNRLFKAVSIGDTAISLSPGRPQIYYEVATSNYYLGVYYLSINDETKAKEQFRLAVDRFYHGASQNIRPGLAFDQLTQFLSAISANSVAKLFGQALVEAPIGDTKISDLTSQLYQWLNDSAQTDDDATILGRQEKLKGILQWLLTVDPKNSELQKQFDALK